MMKQIQIMYYKRITEKEKTKDVKQLNIILTLCGIINFYQSIP